VEEGHWRNPGYLIGKESGGIGEEKQYDGGGTVGDEEFEWTEDEDVGARAEGSGKAERMMEYTHLSMVLTIRLMKHAYICISTLKSGLYLKSITLSTSQKMSKNLPPASNC
jgi:hypothetical protein